MNRWVVKKIRQYVPTSDVAREQRWKGVLTWSFSGFCGELAALSISLFANVPDADILVAILMPKDAS